MQDIRRLVFLDFEACSLSRNSWPIELGWAIVENRCLIEAGSGLIKPTPIWDRAEWSPASEEIHGISLAQLENEGESAEDIWHAFQCHLIGIDTVYSDAPAYDNFWYRRLSEAVGVGLEGPLVRHFAYLFSDMNQALRAWATVKRNITAHRAGPDAKQLAQFYLDHFKQKNQAQYSPPT